VPARNKLKIINDPVYGFITIPSPLVFDIIEHPWFQRLRRIRQLGLTCLTYPSAEHTRFQHALGAMHLMSQAIAVLKSKGVRITAEEAEGLTLAILLHDIGHGPFSHTLEQTLVNNMNHEVLSAFLIEELNRHFDGALDMALSIFTGSCSKKFLHQLVSSQLDMDRLDYLARDSFFTGVAEGVISYDRIIKMLTIHDDELVVEGKGIYSIEKFLISRRLMYWQVYLHKTVIAADLLLVRILQRALVLAASGISLFCSPALYSFIYEKPDITSFSSDSRWPDLFANLDDNDILSAIKAWQSHQDPILSDLSSKLITRRLPRVEMAASPFPEDYIQALRKATQHALNLQDTELDYYFFCDKIENKAYNPTHDRIMILGNDRLPRDISVISGEMNNARMPTLVSKYLLYYPKNLSV
jgi:HD superfamily phosphohydrolase